MQQGDLRSLFDKIGEEYYARFTSKGIIFRMTLEENVHKSYIFDSDELYRLIGALLDTSFLSLREGRIHIRVGEVTDGQDKTECGRFGLEYTLPEEFAQDQTGQVLPEKKINKEYATLKIEVMDTGEGISADEHRKVDSLFERQHRHRIESIKELGTRVVFYLKLKIFDEECIDEYCYLRLPQQEQLSEKEVAATSLKQQYGDFYVHGIEIEKALLLYDNDFSIYSLVLREYLKDGRKRTDTLTKFYEAQQLKEYQISVHALKSGSYAIGAMELGDLAKELEFAARDQEWTIVKQKHPELIRELVRLLELLEEELCRCKLMEQGESQEQSYQTQLLDAIDSFDQEQVFDVLSQMEADEACDLALIRQVREKVEEFNFLDAAKLVEGETERIL